MNVKTKITVENITFSYGSTVVLNKVSLDVKQGEMLGLVGRNGAGKSTLLNVMAGLAHPESGKVSVDGASLSDFNHKERAKRVAMVAQNPAVPPGFSSLDIVLMGRNPHLGLMQWESAYDLEICRKAMDLTQTWDFAERTVTSLSGGERQRVFIARALAQQTPLLLLDEPTTHLDIGYQSEVLDTVKDIQRGAEVTVVAAMHDLSLAAQYCDRLAVLGKGKVVALGPPQEVITAEILSDAFDAEIIIVPHPDGASPIVMPRRKAG